MTQFVLSSSEKRMKLKEVEKKKRKDRQSKGRKD